MHQVPEKGVVLHQTAHIVNDFHMAHGSGTKSAPSFQTNPFYFLMFV
jgi:hypothetical protein